MKVGNGKLTDKQIEFVKNKAAGMTHEAAMVAAGFSVNGASAGAQRLLKLPKIKAALAKARKSPHAAEVDDKDLRNQMPREHYDDPIVFLTDLMNQKHTPLAVRARAAEQLLPYTHARIGEKGKKESKKDEANAIAGRGKFSPKAPPKGSNVVSIR